MFLVYLLYVRHMSYRFIANHFCGVAQNWSITQSNQTRSKQQSNSKIMIFAIIIREDVKYTSMSTPNKRSTSNVFSIPSEILTANNFEHLIIVAQHN
jgi:hypothetical protein